MGQYIRIHVDFDEFDDDELADHLRAAGYTVHAPRKKAGSLIEAPGVSTYAAFGDVDISELGHIETLALCGQRDAAREVALRIVGEAIGRPL